MAAEMAYALLTDIYTQMMDLHLRHWFPDDQSKLASIYRADEQQKANSQLLSKPSLNGSTSGHLLRVKFLKLDVCPPAVRGQITTDWLQLAERFASQTERKAELGCLRYTQDTSVTHLSMCGVVGHKVSLSERCPLTSTRDSEASSTPARPRSWVRAPSFRVLRRVPWWR